MKLKRSKYKRLIKSNLKSSYKYKRNKVLAIDKEIIVPQTSLVHKNIKAKQIIAKQHTKAKIKAKKHSYISAYVLHIVFIICSLLLLNFSYNISDNYTKPIDNIKLVNIHVDNTQNLSMNYMNKVIIPKINIVSEINKASVYKSDWSVSQFKSSYIDSSGVTNTKRGNSIIYGHATPNLFQNLDNISSTDNIYILNSNRVYKYEVTKFNTLSANDIDMAYNLGDHNLSLITCQGENNQYRLIVNAKHINDYSITKKGVI